MNCEHCGGEGAPAGRAGKSHESMEEQQHRAGVQENVRKMMPARRETKELAIEHVRERRERMPVLRVNVRECPAQRVRTQATGDGGILINVILVVVIDEIVA